MMRKDKYITSGDGPHKAVSLCSAPTTLEIPVNPERTASYCESQVNLFGTCTVEWTTLFFHHGSVGFLFSKQCHEGRTLKL